MTDLTPAAIPTPERTLPLTPEVEAKYRALLHCLGSMESAVVAFSGGIDSSLVAYLAHRVLGTRALAVTSGSESLTRDDLGLTGRLAAEWGMAYRVIHTDEMKNPEYRSNPVDRCFHCKSTLYGRLAELAEREGFREVLSGTNLDDQGDYRPGLRAADDHNVRAPLAECGFTKDDIRRLARHLGLKNADKPQAACLSSRVPYGQAISIPVLQQIESAETALRGLGFAQLRVRHHDTVARIEVPPEDFEGVLRQREVIDAALREAGYAYVALDLRGFRSGSLNEGLAAGFGKQGGSKDS